MTTAAIAPPPAEASPRQAPRTQEGREHDAKVSRSEHRIVIFLFGGVFVVATTLMKLLGIVPEEVAKIPAMIGSIVLGIYLFKAAASEIWEGKPSTHTLAALAILAALSIDKYEAAGYVAFILLVFDHALRRTALGALRAIEDLVGLTPDIAHIVEDGTEREAQLEDVQVGMVVRVRPGENLPVDGVIVSGQTTINQASLTGEALPVEVEAGADVFAGTTNLSGTFDMRATLVGSDTTIGKVTELIRQAESARSARQLMVEQVARYFVPIALVTFALVWYLTQDQERAIIVLIAVCPAALLIAGPVAMTCAFTAAARLGIMIKASQHLEAAANIDTIVFDKTGTLTTGKFAVARLAPAPGIEGAELLRAAADAEQASNHPLARSIMHTAVRAQITPDANTQAEEIHGAGVRATLSDGRTILAGRPGWITENSPASQTLVDGVEKQIEGMSGVHVLDGEKYLGAVGLEDRLRYNAQGVIGKLRELGTRGIILMTGDRFAVAKRVGRAVSVDHIEAECLPEEKHALVKKMVADGRRVLMVGDGINDGPSLASADVGVAMGLAGSDIATNSAGIALMNDDISRVPFLIMLARRSRGVIMQNIAASIVIALVGLILAATGRFGIFGTGGAFIAAALYHFIAEGFVLFNSMRLLRFGEEFAAEENFASTSAPVSTRPAQATSTSLVG